MRQSLNARAEPGVVAREKRQPSSSIAVAWKDSRACMVVGLGEHSKQVQSLMMVLCKLAQLGRGGVDVPTDRGVVPSRTPVPGDGGAGDVSETSPSSGGPGARVVWAARTAGISPVSYARGWPLGEPRVGVGEGGPQGSAVGGAQP